MLIFDRLDFLAKENHKSLSYLSEGILGKYRTFLRDVKKGHGKITEEQISILAECLNTTPEYLKGETDIKEKAVTVSDDSLTPEEEDVISIYRSLSPEQKEAFHTLFSKK